MTVENEREKLHREHLSRRLITLGDMMGDGLHLEADGKWISREYRDVFRALYPEEHREHRQRKNKATDEGMKKFLADRPCPCGGTLEQKRSGSKKCKCVSCGKEYNVVKRK